MDNNQIITRLKQKILYLYVEHARISQDEFTLIIYQENTKIQVPIYQLAVLMIGPGTTITHRAVQILADAQCLAVWCGEAGKSIYSVGIMENRTSDKILMQARYYSDDKKRALVARRMYYKRFPDANMESMTIQQMRGAEGRRMKTLYQNLSLEYNVPWHGRKFDIGEFDESDEINKAITAGNQLLYSICHAGIVALGFSPTIGFIHTGTMRSFVYDIADLYKSAYVIHPAFQSLAECGQFNVRGIRLKMRNLMSANNFLQQLCDDLLSLFDPVSTLDMSVGVWDGNNVVEHGRNYG